VRFEVLAIVTMMGCEAVHSGRALLLAACLAYSSALKMEAVLSSEVSVNLYKTKNFIRQYSTSTKQVSPKYRSF
jgi:hypothetical protein